MKNITGTWVYPNNAPVAGGRLFLKLSQDATVSGTAQVAPSLIAFNLNSSGQLPNGSQIFGNDELLPAGTTYSAFVLDANNAPVYGAENFSITGASPVNLNTLIPTSAGVSFPNPVLQNPTAAQTITGFDLNLSSANLNISSGNVLEWNSDTGFSRVAARQIALGNGTNGDTSGFLLFNGGQIMSASSNGADLGFSTAGLYRYGSTAVNGWTSGLPNAALDTGLSRITAATVGVGNGTNGDFSGTVKATSLFLAGKLTSYNNLAVDGNGVSAVYKLTSQKAESAGDANVLTYTPPSAIGSYRVRFTLDLSAANTATLGWKVSWTNSVGIHKTPTNLSLYQVGTAAPALTFTTSTTDSFYGNIDIDLDNSGTNIVVGLTFAGTSFTGKATATIERLA